MFFNEIIKPELKYKKGDIVKIKSYQWYENSRNRFRIVKLKPYDFTYVMTKYCDESLKIIHKGYDYYKLEGNPYYWTDQMFE